MALTTLRPELHAYTMQIYLDSRDESAAEDNISPDEDNLFDQIKQQPQPMSLSSTGVVRH